MDKIVPVISLIVSVLAAAISIAAFTLMLISVSVPAVALTAVPLAIIGTVLSGVSAAITFLFSKSKLCRAAFFINLVSLAISLAAIIVWQAAL